MFRKTVIATLFAIGCSSAQAGSFVSLPDDLVDLSVVNGGLVQGANNPNADPLYIRTTGITFLSGFADTTPFPAGSGNVVATSIQYETFAPGAPGVTTGSGTLSLLDWQVTTDVPLLTGVPQATIYDFVYQDSADGKLVFATRYLNVVDNDQEVNYLYRNGFENMEVSAAWTFLTDSDLRMYQAGRTESEDEAEPVPFDDDAVRMQADLSATEGNPWSGLFMVKVDEHPFFALTYRQTAGAVGFAQAGEEGQQEVAGAITGYAPAEVPIPESYGLLLAGLGALGVFARRRKA